VGQLEAGGITVTDTAADFLDERSFAALRHHSGLQCGRLLRRWTRDPAAMIQALVYPAFTLVMLRIVLGDSITAATGSPSIFGTVPLIVLVGAMFGSVVSAVGLRAERESGLLGRFHTLPVHRFSGLVGRLTAEIVRVIATTVVILVAGFALGFRFTQGPVAAVLFFAVPVVFTVGFATIVTFLATLSTKLPLVEVVSALCTLLMFFNSGFVPVAAYPGWLQPFVAGQPMSLAVDAMRGLSYGGPVLVPFLQTAAWTVGIVAVLMVPVVHGYRRAAETG